VSCDVQLEGGATPVVPGAVTKVTYAAGRSCNLSLEPSPSQEGVAPVPNCPEVGWVPFKAAKVTTTEVASTVHVRKFPIGVYGCPNKLRLPSGCAGISGLITRQLPVEWSFQARRPVTSSRSWYEWSLQPPARCGGGQSSATSSNIHAGQILRYSTFLEPRCHGTYQITVGFMPQAPAGQNDNNIGGSPGRDGSIVVGRASFTIP
jgi:hypothetical protein